MIIQFPERTYTEEQKQIILSIYDKVNKDLDFLNDDFFNTLSIEEQYLYIGFIMGANSVLKSVTEVDNPEINKIIEGLFSEQQGEI